MRLTGSRLGGGSCEFMYSRPVFFGSMSHMHTTRARASAPSAPNSARPSLPAPQITNLAHGAGAAASAVCPDLPFCSIAAAAASAEPAEPAEPAAGPAGPASAAAGPMPSTLRSKAAALIRSSCFRLTGGWSRARAADSVKPMERMQGEGAKIEQMEQMDGAEMEQTGAERGRRSKTAHLIRSSCFRLTRQLPEVARNRYFSTFVAQTTKRDRYRQRTVTAAHYRDEGLGRTGAAMSPTRTRLRRPAAWFAAPCIDLRERGGGMGTH